MSYWGPVEKGFWLSVIGDRVQNLIAMGTGDQIVHIKELQISEAIEYKLQIQQELIRVSEMAERLKALEYQLTSAVRDGKNNV